MVLKATHTVMGILRELREMGFLIALDDFGTGNNSFSLLRNMPVDIIKIDKSYTQRIEDDTIAQVFVSAVCEIAKALDMMVVAEGVETEAQQTCARLPAHSGSRAGCTDAVPLAGGASFADPLRPFGLSMRIRSLAPAAARRHNAGHRRQSP